MLKDYGIEAVRYSPFCDAPDEKGLLSKLRKTFLINSLIVFNKFNVFHSVMHYKTFEESVELWERRKPRINWYNLFVVMWSTKREELEQFDALPYGKKVCFVPFKSDLDSAWYVEHRLKEQFPMYVHYVLQTAHGNPFYYDPFDMLLYGKKTPLIDM